MKKITFFTFLCSLLLVACSREEWSNTANTDTPEAVLSCMMQTTKVTSHVQLH